MRDKIDHPIRLIIVKATPHTSRGRKHSSTGPSSDGSIRFKRTELVRCSAVDKNPSKILLIQLIAFASESVPLTLCQPDIRGTKLPWDIHELLFRKQSRVRSTILA